MSDSHCGCLYIGCPNFQSGIDRGRFCPLGADCATLGSTDWFLAAEPESDGEAARLAATSAKDGFGLAEPSTGAWMEAASEVSCGSGGSVAIGTGGLAGGAGVDLELEELDAAVSPVAASYGAT